MAENKKQSSWKVLATLLAATFLGSSAMAADTSDPHHDPSHGHSHSQTANDPATIAYEAAKGKMQSPINLVSAEVSGTAGLLNMKFDYKDTPLNIKNDGHTIVVNVPEGNNVTINGHQFELKQCHFHFPSEYAIDGKVFDGELHCVHMDRNGNLGVIGVLIEEGKEHPEAAKIWDHFPESGETKDVPEVRVNAANFIPENKSHFALMGSLTTPPYTEGLFWHVLETPIQFSPQQIKQFQDTFEPNARDLQKRNNRPVTLNY